MNSKCNLNSKKAFSQNTHLTIESTLSLDVLSPTRYRKVASILAFSPILKCTISGGIITVSPSVQSIAMK